MTDNRCGDVRLMEQLRLMFIVYCDENDLTLEDGENLAVECGDTLALAAGDRLAVFDAAAATLTEGAGVQPHGERRAPQDRDTE